MTLAISWISLVTFADGSDFQRGLQHIRKKNWVSKKTALWGVTITIANLSMPRYESQVQGHGVDGVGSMVTAWSFLDPRKAKSLFYIWLHGSTCNLYILSFTHSCSLTTGVISVGFIGINIKPAAISLRPKNAVISDMDLPRLWPWIFFVDYRCICEYVFERLNVLICSTWSTNSEDKAVNIFHNYFYLVVSHNFFRPIWGVYGSDHIRYIVRCFFVMFFRQFVPTNCLWPGH